MPSCGHEHEPEHEHAHVAEAIVCPFSPPTIRCPATTTLDNDAARPVGVRRKYLRQRNALYLSFSFVRCTGVNCSTQVTRVTSARCVVPRYECMQTRVTFCAPVRVSFICHHSTRPMMPTGFVMLLLRAMLLRMMLPQCGGIAMFSGRLLCSAEMPEVRGRSDESKTDIG